jgi:hypothetical protein
VSGSYSSTATKSLCAKGACAAALACLSLATGCSTDIFDTTVNLGSEAYDADFGCANGTIPTVTCNPDSASVCTASQTVDTDASAATGVPASVSVTPGCDGTSDLCFAQVSARLVYPVNVLQDDNFVSAVARRSISLVRLADLAYTVPIDTLTFEAPAVDIHVGPAGTTTETDPGVVLVGSTAAIPAGTPVDAPMHLTIADGSPARTLIEQSIQAEQTFVFVLTLAPRIEAGQTIPAGAVEVDLFPQIQLGF